MSGYAIFDIESRVDKRLLAATLYPNEWIAGEITPELAFDRHTAELVEKYGTDFVSIPFHVPISIAVASVGDDCRLLGAVETIPGDERGMVEEFWRRTNAFRGCLVSFNGRGFDLPVLELQGMRYGIAARSYYGAKYGPRYRFQTDGHLDLQEFVGNYGTARMRGGLDVLLRLCGYAGKGEIHGRDVQALYEAGRLDEIHDYCRRDVAGTYLLFLRVQVIRGLLDSKRADELAHGVLEQLGSQAA